MRSVVTTRRRQPARNMATLLSRGSCAGRAQNKLPHRFGEALVLVAAGLRARLRLHLVAHRDGKAALAEHEDVIRHVPDRGDLRGAGMFRSLDRVVTPVPLLAC